MISNFLFIYLVHFDFLFIGIVVLLGYRVSAVNQKVTEPLDTSSINKNGF